MKNKAVDYYLGLDIGTTSVGWAVTSPDYKLLRTNGKDMWGSHLFGEAQTAAVRRGHRSQRRRYQRRARRIEILRDLFKAEINKIDSLFFERLRDSKFFAEDKRTNQTNTLFNDKNYTDKDYHKAYPTIYHLRQSLLEKGKTHDVRLVYLAIHYMMKHRGHFLLEGKDFEIDGSSSFKTLFQNLILIIQDHYPEADFPDINEDETFDSLEEIFKDKDINRKDKDKAIKNLLDFSTSQSQNILKMLLGFKVKISTLLDNEDLATIFVDKNDKEKTISLLELSEDEQQALYENLDVDQTSVFNSIKAVYDWLLLSDILQESKNLSEAKVKTYDNHARNLKTLKNLVKNYLTYEEYIKIFKSTEVKNNYCAYIGKDTDGNALHSKRCTQDEFCKFLETYINKVIDKTINIEKLRAENPKLETEKTSIKKLDYSTLGEIEKQLIKDIFNANAFPKQLTSSNCVIPYQLHLKELEEILENAKEYLPFLDKKDENGYSVIDKVIATFTFKIPYYIGPVVDSTDHEFAWVVKKKNEKVYPWNFDEVIDKQTSAKNFITRMTNKCTYIKYADVLPKDSILYSKFNILNQLNILRVNDNPISVDLKQKLYKDLFTDIDKPQKVTAKKIVNYIKSYQGDEDVKLEGIDQEITGDCKALLDFKRILGNKFTEKEISTYDEIVAQIVILGENKEILSDYLKDNFKPLFTDDEIDKISKLQYSGWGRLSKEFLTEVEHINEETAECINIITMLYDTNNNLQKILSSDYEYLEKIEDINREYLKDSDIKQILDDSYVSPAVKRGIKRTLAICKEIEKICGKPPKKIFVEMARDTNNENKGKRSVSRKNQLSDLYKTAKLTSSEVYKELDNLTDNALNSKKIFLYFQQMGRCMYSGKKIDLSELILSSGDWNIEHIYPRCVVKDDSLTNNLVLVKEELNEEKGDKFPICSALTISKETKDHWKMLVDNKLITKEKYNRLTRATGFTVDEFTGFIARQLVETRQSTKEVTKILEHLYKGKTRIVYVKAGNISDFRNTEHKIYEESEQKASYKFLKSRLANDHHHAKDAYLAIVVGNVYDNKFTSDHRKWVKNKVKKNKEENANKQPYSISKIFERDVKKPNTSKQELVWIGTRSKSGTPTIELVNKYMRKQTVLYTRYAYIEKGSLYKVNPLQAGEGQLPLKTCDKRMHDISKYGAYDKEKGAFFCFYKYVTVDGKGKEKLSKEIGFIPVSVSQNMKNKQDINIIRKYIISKLLQENKGLVPEKTEVLIPVIKKNSLLKVNGFPVHLTGRSGSSLKAIGALQLSVPEKLYEHIRIVEKYHEKIQKDKNLYVNETIQKNLLELNIQLYDFLLEKLNSSIYTNRPTNPIGTLFSSRNTFISLDLFDQISVLYQFVKIMNNGESASMSLINCSSRLAMIRFSNKATLKNQISLVNQSITGIFEQEIDLNEL